MQQQSTEPQPREIKARYLTAGMTAVIDGQHLTVSTIHRYAIDTVLAYFEGVPTPTSYNVEEGVTVVGDATEPPTPDYWLTLAADLRQAADRIATLAGTPVPPGVPGAHLSVAYSYSESDADKSVPVIDAIAAAFGAEAATKTEGRGASRRTERLLSTRVGKVSVRAVAVMPAPPTRQQSRAALEARVAELEAQLVEGGAR